MKRIRSKETTKKIVSRKRISSRISNTLQEESLQTFNLQNTNNPTLLHNGDGESGGEEVLLNEDIIYDIPIEFHITESDFTLDSYTDSSDQSTISEETEQQAQQSRRVGPKQTIVESEANFQPLPGEYGPYFQNFTEMMLFTWVIKHMICKLNFIM
jgi:hypothetical protein